MRLPSSSNADHGTDVEPPGTIIADRYEVVELLGEGMSGRVYRARQLGLDRDIAVKVLHPHRSADDTFVERFRAEAKIASRLHTPHSAAVYDYGEHNGSLYLAMQLIDGRLLENVLAEGAQSVARACNLAAQIATGLAAIHKANIVHADLKPGNAVLVDDPETERERVVLIDFGIAREEDAEHTPVMDESGREIVSGTPGYVAPEVIRGGTPVAASDVYACGVLLFELLVGEPPFDGDALDVVRRHAFDPRPVPSERAPGLPLELDDICTAAMAIEPDKRPTARALRDRLYEVLHGLSVVMANPWLVARPVPEIQTAEPEAVGHERQVADLADLLRGRRGPGANLVGLSGSGRTTAVERACATLPDGGARVLRIGSHPSGEPVPAAPLRALVAWLDVRHDGDDAIGDVELEALLARELSDQVCILGLLDLLAPEPLLPGLIVAERRALHARAVISALGALGRRYDAIVFDNVEEYDDTTRRLLHEVARRGIARPALLFVTHPADDVAPGWPRIELEPLEGADVSALVADVTGSLAEADTVVALAEFSRGVPGRLIQAAAYYADAGRVPRSEDHAIAARLKSLSSDTRALVRLLAVAGKRARVSWLEAIAIADESFDARVDQALLAGLLRRQGGWLMFVSRSVRDAIYRQLDPVERAALHNHVASADDDQPALVRGRHFARARRAEQAVELLCTAGVDAARRGEGTAVSVLQSALQAASSARARGHGAAAVANAGAAGAELAIALCDAGSVGRAQGVLNGLFKRFGVGAPGTPTPLRLVQACARVSFERGDSDKALALLDRHMQALQGARRGAGFARQAEFHAQLAAKIYGPAAAARDLCRRASGIADAPGMLQACCALRLCASRYAVDAAAFHLAIREAEAACAAAAALGDHGLRWVSERALARALRRSGETEAAERQSGKAMAALAKCAADLVGAGAEAGASRRSA